MALVAIPMLADMKISCPSMWKGRPSACCIRSATTLASPTCLMPVEQNGELVPSEPGDRVFLPDPGDGVAGAQALLEPLRNFDQQLVAEHMAETVVHQLEAVEVEEQDREHLAGMAGRASDQAFQPIEEQNAIRAARSAHRTPCFR